MSFNLNNLNNLHNLQVVKRYPDAKLPTRESDYDAGLDLYSVEDGLVLPRKTCLVDTGISIRLPELKLDDPNIKLYGKIASRSGLAVKHNVYAFHGTIDYLYTGNIKVQLINYSDENFYFNKHDRIAQLIPTLYYSCNVEQVDSFLQVESQTGSIRRDKGFGSSGN